GEKMPPPSAAPPAGPTAAMITERGSDGTYEIYDIGHNQVLAAFQLTQIATQWKLVDLAGFNGADTSDMLIRNSNTGAFELHDIGNNNITATAPLGQVGLEFSVAGFGSFSGHANETRTLGRDAGTGGIGLYSHAQRQ